MFGEKIFKKIFLIGDNKMKYKCIICGEVLEPGSYFCDYCARENGIAGENGEFRIPEEWEDWVRDYYDVERELRRLNSEKILEIEQNLG